jgi:sugar-specific transcriptional regulator TrmB
MTIKPELVRKIKDYFNLNIYETKVWMALLGKGVASAGEIAETSGVPRSRTYDVLESLEKRGFAIAKIGKPVKYLAVKPTEVIEKMKSNLLQDAQERVKSLVNLKETPEYLELEQLHTSGISPIKSHEITGSLKGRANVMAKIRELLESSKKEVMICTSAVDFEDKSRILIPALEKLNKSNVKVKIALSGDADKVNKLNIKHGLKAKHTESSARVFVKDKTEALLMVTPHNSEEEMGIWLSSPYFTDYLARMLESSLKNGSVVN